MYIILYAMADKRRVRGEDNMRRWLWHAVEADSRKCATSFTHFAAWPRLDRGSVALNQAPVSNRVGTCVCDFLVQICQRHFLWLFLRNYAVWMTIKRFSLSFLRHCSLQSQGQGREGIGFPTKTTSTQRCVKGKATIIKFIKLPS